MAPSIPGSYNETFNLENKGFAGDVGPHPSTGFPKGSNHNEPFKLADEITDSSNTTKLNWPTPAGGNYGLRRY